MIICLRSYPLRVNSLTQADSNLYNLKSSLTHDTINKPEKYTTIDVKIMSTNVFNPLFMKRIIGSFP